MAVANVENVESGRRNSEEQQKAPLTFRLNAPQVSLMNNGEQVLDRPLRGLGARRAAGDCGPYHGVGTAGRRGLRPLPWGWHGGPQGTAAPTMGLARRAAGDCGPYRGPLGAECTRKEHK